MLIIVCLLFYTLDAILSPEEQLFICKYDNLTGFPVRCQDAANACAYTGIGCRATLGATWNETIVSLDLEMTFPLLTKDAIPTEIGYLRALQNLSLSSNRGFVVHSSIPSEIGLCRELTSIFLAIRAGGILPVELFTGPTKLSYLYIPVAGLIGTVPEQVGDLTHLTFLSLHYNQLSGTFPSIAKLTRLVELDLRFNLFIGSLPNTLTMPELAFYKLTNNAFSGDVPLFNSSVLAYIDVSHNNLDGTLSSIIQTTNSVPLLFVASANRLKGTIPTNLFGPNLVTLDLSYNDLSGTVPSEMMVSFAMLQELDLSHNSLSGSLSSDWINLSMPLLSKLRLNHNQLTGSIPSLVIGALIVEPSHIYLNFNDNAFSGPISTSFDNFPVSSSLDLSNNALTLSLSSFGSGINVSWLNLAGNPLATLPTSLFSDLTRFVNLISLDLSECQLTGTLPIRFHVQYLKLNNNFFTGSVPFGLVVQYLVSRRPVFVDLRLNRLETESNRESHVGSSSSFIIDDVITKDFPQDIDECILGVSECEYLCVDGWFPIPGYTCACPSGYELDPVNKRNCSALCGDGLLRYPEEECDYEYSLQGCFHNCTTKPGYRCDARGCTAICGDGLLLPPEECDNKGAGCDPLTCRVKAGYTCSLETNTCQPCAQSWTPFTYPPNLALFPHLRALLGDLSVFAFTSCVSCTDGYALETRAVLAVNQCLNMSTQRSLPCSFACSNLTVFSSASESIYTLENELMRGDFILVLFRSLFNVNITLNSTLQESRKRGLLPVSTVVESLDFNVAPCSVDTSGMMDVIKALALDIVPNLPLPELRTTQCGVALKSTEVTKEAFLSTLIIVSCAVALLFICGLCTVYYYYRQSELHSLPEDIAWSFLDQWTHPWRWEYHGSSKSGYHARTYDPSSEEYRRVESLLTTHFKKGLLKVSQITAVYNKALSVSFVNQWKLMTTRRIEAPDHFFHCTFMKDAKKLNVMKYYQDNLLQFTPYNQTLQVPLLPVLHGTDYLVAEKIAQTGFASLSSLDPGYFGKGIYFTTSLLYTLPYSCGKRRPAVIVSYINMGHIFPVTEDHKGPHSLKGQALKSGYNSHLALTGKEGYIYNELDDVVVCDEIVVNQESQILPAFLVELDIETCQTEYQKWVRDIPLPVNDAALQNHVPLSPHTAVTSTEGTLLSVVSMEDAYAYQVYDV